MVKQCAACDTQTTSKWRFHDGYFLCEACRMKYVRGPNYYPLKNAKDNPRRICFGRKRIVLKENPRKGICKLCNKKFKLTHMHHTKYHDDDVLKDTMELCLPCHAKTRIGMKYNVARG